MGLGPKAEGDVYTRAQAAKMKVLEPRMGIFRSVRDACRAFAFALSRATLEAEKDRDVMDAYGICTVWEALFRAQASLCRYPMSFGG